MRTERIIRHLIIIMVLLLAGCASSPKPASVVERFLEDKKDEIRESMEESLGTDEDSFFGGSESRFSGL